MTNVGSLITKQQKEWAANSRILVDRSNYTETLDANLFQSMGSRTLADFQSGSGDELGEKRRRGKMQALHSSSALAVNVFDYWRYKSMEWISGAFSLNSQPLSVRFEAKFPTGLQGNPPNLDIEFLLADHTKVVVESKFTEPYFRAKKVAAFKSAYFPDGNGLWQNRSLSRCQKLASRLHRNELQFQYLNAAQLLKHILGLAQPEVGQFKLVYLWYAMPCDEASQHGEEIKLFASQVGSEIDFCAFTYQELFCSTLSHLRVEHRAYISYLRERYFPEL